MRARSGTEITRRLNVLFASEEVANEQQRLTRKMDHVGTDWADENW